MRISFLDVVIPGQPYRPPRRPPVEDTITDVKKEVPDTLQDSIAQMQDFAAGGTTGSDDNSMLLWGIIVVFVALILCLWFAYTYRQRIKVSRQ